MIIMGMLIYLQPANPCAEGLTQFAFWYVRPRRLGSLTFNMVMVAYLWQTYFSFKPKDLLAIFTHVTIHSVIATKYTFDTLC